MAISLRKTKEKWWFLAGDHGDLMRFRRTSVSIYIYIHPLLSPVDLSLPVLSAVIPIEGIPNPMNQAEWDGIGNFFTHMEYQKEYIDRWKQMAKNIVE
jgi:hypothetical protein